MVLQKDCSLDHGSAIKIILIAFSEIACLNETEGDPKFCKNYLKLSLNVFSLSMNCLISRRIYNKLYILWKWQQACLNDIKFMVELLGAFSLCFLTINVWNEEHKNIFFRAHSSTVLFFVCIFLLTFCCVFLLFSTTKDVTVAHCLSSPS